MDAGRTEIVPSRELTDEERWGEFSWLAYAFVVHAHSGMVSTASWVSRQQGPDEDPRMDEANLVRLFVAVAR